MARPKPTILLSHLDKRWRAVEILAAQAVFVVCLDGQPIGVRDRDTLRDSTNKYRRSAFINGGHAYALVRRLNRLFKTDRFAVMHYPSAEILSEADYYREYEVKIPPGFSG